MSPRARWLTAAFLTIIAAAGGWEVWAATDDNPDTWPLTDLIGTYIPEPVTMAVIAVMVAWVPAHFAYYYRRRARRAEQALHTAADRAEATLRSHSAARYAPATMGLLADAVRRAIHDDDQAKP